MQSTWDSKSDKKVYNRKRAEINFDAFERRLSIYGVAKCQIAWTQSTLSVPYLDVNYSTHLFIDGNQNGAKC